MSTLVAFCSLAAFCALAIACGAPRDTVEIGRSTKDGPPKPVGDAGPPGYEYVVRRSLGTVGLAERDGLEPAEAHALVDLVASDLDRCLGEFLEQGHLARGAARVEANVDENGGLTNVDIRVSPGEDATKNAVLCVITPVRKFAFTSSKAHKPRRAAIEAVWQPLGAP